MAKVQMANLKTKLETRAPIDDNDCNARTFRADMFLRITGLVSFTTLHTCFS